MMMSTPVERVLLDFAAEGVAVRALSSTFGSSTFGSSTFGSSTFGVELTGLRLAEPASTALLLHTCAGPL